MLYKYQVNDTKCNPCYSYIDANIAFDKYINKCIEIQAKQPKFNKTINSFYSGESEPPIPVKVSQ